MPKPTRKKVLCSICGQEVSNPNTKSHINSAKHQKAFNQSISSSDGSQKKISDIRQISVTEFVKKIKRESNSSDLKFVLFIGAGCSISSGIPGASTLTKRWLDILKEEKGDNYENWLYNQKINEKKENLAIYYNKVIEETFETPFKRQTAIETIIQGKSPNLGYAILARLLSNEKFGNKFNFVLTTNFDDLMADALYIFSNSRPLVITHESLISFIKITRQRPVVIKLHGDAKILPKNTKGEIEKIQENVKKVLKNLLKETGIIFIGYGGNDNSIIELFQEFSKEENEIFPMGIYWVADQLPDSKLRDWLINSKATHVKHFDFDELMIYFIQEFDLQLPRINRFEQLYKDIFDRFKEIRSRINTSQEKEEKAELISTMDLIKDNLDSPIKYYLEASRYEKNDSDKAESIYQEGLENYPSSALLISYYAIFLTEIQREYDKAEMLFKKSIELDQQNDYYFKYYAIFLSYVRRNYKLAEIYFLKSIEIDPYNADNNRVYGNFLSDIRRNYDLAEEYFKKALSLDMEDDNIHRDYGDFLKYKRKDYDLAERHFKRALEIDSENADNYNSYAIFLTDIRREHTLAENYFKKGLVLDPENAYIYKNYAEFLDNIRLNYESAEEYFKKALELDPLNCTFHSSFANFLNYIRQDYDLADEHFRKALELDPKNDDTYREYADFLRNITKRYDLAEEYYEKALELDPLNDSNYNGFAIYLTDIKKDFNRAKEYYLKALELDPKDDFNHRIYAIFLSDNLKDYDLAEKNFKKAIDLDPNNGSNYSSYAVFLDTIRNQAILAEEYFKKALNLDPNNRDIKSNYIGFQLSVSECYNKNLLEKLRDFLKLNNLYFDLLIELLFYGYCFFELEKEKNSCLRKLKNSLKEGNRSYFWKTTNFVKKAIDCGHNYPDFVKDLADVISDEKSITELDKYNIWKSI